MEQQWNKLIKTTKLDIKNYVDKQTNRYISQIKGGISKGHQNVTNDQKDLKTVIVRIKAVNKKFELERKIKHMGINEAVLRKEEMEEKLRLLNQNIKYLATDEDRIEEANDEEEEAEGDNEDQQLNRKGKNRRSVDAIHNLEDKLGLPISERNARIMNYKDKMHVSKDELVKSQASAEQFVAKMKEKKQELKNKRKQRRDKEAYKTQSYLSKASEKKKELEEERKQKVLERIEEHKQHLEKEKEARAERENHWKEFKQKEKTSKPLYKKIEDKYKSDILMPELERKKRQLGDIRKFHNPIKREDLDEHEKNYQERIKIEREKQRLKREKWYSEIGYGVYDENRYKTKFYDKAREEEKQKENVQRVESQERKRKNDKMNNYAKIVKEMHWPQVSERKKKELEELKHNMEHSNKPHFRSPRVQSRYNSSESPEREKILKKPNWKKFHNPMIPKPEPKREPVKVDWLAERRNKRGDDTKSHMSHSQAWRTIADKHDLDDNSKAQLLKTKAKLLEEQAQRKEQMNKVKGSTMEGTVEVNEMLIDAIESKLSLLDNYMKE